MKRSKKGPKSTRKVNWQKAPDIEQRVKKIAASLDLNWIKKTRVFCFRSIHSQTRAAARIWGLSRIWQQALIQKPAYVIEVISEKFDRLTPKQQDRVLIHELAHIPKTFSGALLPHTRKRKGSFRDKLRKFLIAYDQK